MLSSATLVSANLSEHYINCEPTTRFLVDVVNIGQTINFAARPCGPLPTPKKRDSRHIVTKNIACKVEV